MKKIIIIFLLITSSAFGQVYFSGTRQPLYDTGADSLITRMETAVGKTMTTAGKEFISDMFTMYKDSLSITSLQNFFDVLYFLDIGEETAGKLNWVKNAHNITNVNSVTFDSTGAIGNGTTAYLNLNYNPSTQKVNVSLNSVSLGVYNKTESFVANLCAIGCFQSSPQSGMSMYHSTGSKDFFGRLFSNASWTDTRVQTTALGMWALVRTDTANIQSYYNSDLWSDTVLYTNIIPNLTLYMLVQNTNGSPAAGTYSNRKYSFTWIGKECDATEIRKIYNIQRYWATNKNSITFFNP